MGEEGVDATEVLSPTPEAAAAATTAAVHIISTKPRRQNDGKQEEHQQQQQQQLYGKQRQVQMEIRERTEQSRAM